MNQKALIILLIIFSCNSNTQKQIIEKDSKNIIIVQQGDKEMEAAIYIAKSSLYKFDSALFTNKSDYNSFALKVRFAYGNNNGEHIWLSDITKIKGEYMGIVNNEPEYVSNLKLNDTISVNKDDISDWMYLDKDILKGGFTIRLLRDRMTAIERAAFDSNRFYKF
ncbi:DUF2314 domain-containing protein [Ferruginibacter sp.]